ncbi:beta-ketoacyl-ACP synthase III [Aestuariivirga litoralis]|uniref:beta-ketoacyl-ACP synthase III n=1 Tax=Aestuariivirga litoralis TaxID=2650924 RepID=UPI0018C847F4|nr:beta-ketoacyl-ACP synthase III [Aestuariivirga litoralis]MBG1231790.1 ketoacyl-ACP synthase III [Aestuariivirga litoralis]
MTRSVIAGVGSALPRHILTNDDLSKIVDTTDAWITERTGIKARHIAGDDETTKSLAVEAARNALAHAGLEASAVDLIVLATSTPDHTFPATATEVQAELGITKGAAFDLQAVCSGFIYALTTADALIKSGQATCALVIGSETFSRILDWNDRATCVLFGDGAGAFVITANDGEEGGIMNCKLRSDGRYQNKLYVDGGPSTTKTVGHLRMEGREVFKHAVTNMHEVIGEILRAADVKVADIDWFVPHQANKRILDTTAGKLGVPTEKFIVTLDKHGNTSAASIPLAFDYGVKQGLIKRGQLVLMEAMGGGFTWGGILARF